MTTTNRHLRLPVADIDLSAQPQAVIRLVEHLDRVTGTNELLLSDVPSGLRSADALIIAMRHGLVRVVVRWGSPIGTAHELIGVTFSWIDYRQAGYPDDLEEAMAKDEREPGSGKRLHIRLTSAAVHACAELRLRSQDVPPPTDLIPASVASQRYHITKKGLYEAVADGRLRNYRPPGSAHNAPFRFSEADVARNWPKKPD